MTGTWRHDLKGTSIVLGKLAWNCVRNDRHSFFEEELEELERRK